MNELVDTTNVRRVLTHAKIDHVGKDFEALYSDLYQQDPNSSVVRDIEWALRSYFENLAMPDEPTLYDHLVLSLTSKDLIATFNWDPFLYHAFYRNRSQPELPQAVYLHGNVAIGYCPTHRQKSANGSPCSTCGELLTPSKLLYPVREKNYTEDDFIRAEWAGLRSFLRNAFVFTIFGYSAPKTDVEAIRLMREAWGKPAHRELEEIEIIDIQDESQLRGSWSDFIHSHHYRTTNSFYDSLLSSFPTRSCHAMWEELMEVKFLNYQCRLPREADHEELWKWRQELLDTPPDFEAD